MRIEFGDFEILQEARMHLDDCIKRNWISAGPKVKEFEEKWGQLFGYKYNISMDNGTSADMAACMTLYDLARAERGDEIIAPACAFAAVGNSIVHAGFKPVFVDIERETMNINPKKIKEKITPKTRAIMAVHTMGKPCEMDTLMDIAKKYGIYVIEDSCEAHGAKYKDKFVGQWGDMATFSFYAAHLICTGEGGMVSTNNERIATLLRSVKSHGRKPGTLYFDHERLGLNFKMNDLEASIGIPQAGKYFWETFNKRKENLYYLLKKTEDIKKFAIFNIEKKHEIVCPHAFTVTLRDPKYGGNVMPGSGALFEFLEMNSIRCKRNFGSMPTQHKAFEFLGYKLGDFPEAEYMGDNGLHFGIHQKLNKTDLDYVSSKLHEYFAKFK